MKNNKICLTGMSIDHINTILQLQHSLMPKKKHWSAEEAKSSLTDSAHSKGENVILAWDSVTKQLVGVGAWIIGSNGESFGSPLLAANEEAAVILLEAVEKEARAAKSSWLRVMTLITEVSKSMVLEKRGFKRTFDFVEFEINPKRKAISQHIVT